MELIKSMNRVLTGTFEESDVDFLIEILEHGLRVAKYSRAVAGKLGFNGEALFETVFAAMLHDLGKMKVDQSILSAPRRLTDEEKKIVSRHSYFSYEILEGLDNSNVLWLIMNHHHKGDLL